MKFINFFLDWLVKFDLLIHLTNICCTCFQVLGVAHEVAVRLLTVNQNDLYLIVKYENMNIYTD